ncbi:MAG: NAD(+)/NADH kinase [Chloroflexota bacterium]
MQTVALIYQPARIEAKQLAESCYKIVESSGFVPRLLSAWELDPAVEDSSGVHLAVTFGGDGTIIRAARWLAGSGIPILGVAMGKLGYLTELPPQNVHQQLPSILAGNYWKDERLMLSAQVHAAPEPGGDTPEELAMGHNDDVTSAPLLALNDVVIARGASPRVVQVDLSVDGVHVVHYVADGLIVSSSTGSTAYALAAGGPVLAPGVEAMVVVPIAAHMAVLRSLVVPASACVEVRASAEQPTLLVLDGQVQIPLRNNQPVTVSIAKERTVFARLGNDSSFYKTLVEGLKKR